MEHLVIWRGGGVVVTIAKGEEHA